MMMTSSAFAERYIIHAGTVEDLLIPIKDVDCMYKKPKGDQVYIKESNRYFIWHKRQDLFIENVGHSTCAVFKRKPQSDEKTENK